MPYQTKKADLDEAAHAFSKVLNTRVLVKDVTEESLAYSLRLLVKCLRCLKPLSLTNEEQLRDQYFMFVQGTAIHFEVEVINPVDLWPILRKVKQDGEKVLWSLIELCLCRPYGNAVTWQFFISYCL